MKLCWMMLFLLSFEGLTDSGQKELAGYSAAYDVISEDYVAGPYLIYDCKAESWVCVLKEDHDDCTVKRDEDLFKGKKKLSCAPLSLFPTKKSCFQRQLYLVSQNHGSRFCMSDIWKKRELK